MRHHLQAHPAPHRRTVLVLGGAGFIGRHAAAALSAMGAQVIIASRHPQRAHRRLPQYLHGCARRALRIERCLQADDWAAALEGIDAVVNCVGILRPRHRETYERVHHLAVAALAKACAQRGLRVVHVSALGLAEDRNSGFLTSKWNGEQALMKSGADWYLVRPSLLDGPGGFGAKWIRRVANWPVHLVPADAKGLLAPVDVNDVGEGIAALALRPAPAIENHVERIFELGGPEHRTMAEHLQAMRAAPGVARAQLRLPPWLARLSGYLLDALHLTPYSYGHYELLTRDNLPQPNRLAELLGRTPTIPRAALASEKESIKQPVLGA